MDQSVTFRKRVYRHTRVLSMKLLKTLLSYIPKMDINIPLSDLKWSHWLFWNHIRLHTAMTESSPLQVPTVFPCWITVVDFDRKLTLLHGSFLFETFDLDRWRVANYFCSRIDWEFFIQRQLNLQRFEYSYCLKLYVGHKTIKFRDRGNLTCNRTWI